MSDGQTPPLLESLRSYQRASAVLDVAALRAARAAGVRGDPVSVVACEPGCGEELACRAIHASSSRAAEPFLVAHVQPGAHPMSLDGALAFPAGTLAVFLRGHTDEAHRHFAMQVRHAVDVGGSARGVVVVVGPGRMTRDPLASLHAVAPLPLRERREDIPDLAEHFAGDGSGAPAFTFGALAALMRAPWPGNVEEFEAVVRATCAAHPGVTVAWSDLPETVRGVSDGPGLGLLREGVAAAERAILRRALALHGGAVGRAAVELGIPERTMRRRMQERKCPKELFRRRKNGLRA